MIIAILAFTIVGCKLFDSKRWDKVNRQDAERVRKCYKYSSGNVYCEDTKQNY